MLQSSCDRVVSDFETCFTLSCNQTVIRSRNKLMMVWLRDRLTMKGTIFRGESVVVIVSAVDTPLLVSEICEPPSPFFPPYGYRLPCPR